MKKLLTFSLLSLSITSSFANPLFGIVSAVPSESAYVLQHMSDKKVVKKGIYTYTTGRIGKTNVVDLVMGVGVINSAVATSNLIEHFHPKYLILTGTAGAINPMLKVGDVVIVNQSTLFFTGNPNQATPVWPNFGNNPARRQPDSSVYKSSDILLKKAKWLISDNLNLKAQNREDVHSQAKITFGAVGSSDHFPNSQWEDLKMKANHMDVVAMETGAFLKTCWLYQTKCIAFRAVSDIANPLRIDTRYTSWNTTNATLAANHAGKVTVDYINHWESK